MKFFNKLFKWFAIFNVNEITEPISHATLTLSIDYMAKPFSGADFT